MNFALDPGQVSEVEHSPPDLVGLAMSATVRARDYLLELQSTAGSWRGGFETNVTIEAEDLLFREFLGIRSTLTTECAARWIRSKQAPEGWWTNCYGGPPDLSTTVEAYLALRIAGDLAEADHMRRAAAWVRNVGGISATRVFTRVWLALFAEWSWDELPALPPEIVLLPRHFPLNLFDFACWARATFVPLTVVFSVRPARPLGFTIDELRAPHTSRTSAPRRSGLRAFFDRVDVALHGYERLVPAAAPLGALRRLTLRRALDWVVRRQESDGSLAGLQLPSMFGLIALHLGGYALDHPVVATGLAGLDRYAVVEDAPGGRVRRIDAARSDVWDTALAVTALLDAGEAGDHPALRKACRFLLDQEIRVCADWSVPRPGLEPGCWGFGLYNDFAPDADDTAEVVVALHRAASHRRLAAEPAAELWSAATAAAGRGATWATGMQSRSGGWGAFDADNTAKLPSYLPFCDFGEVTDPPCADVTAHVLEMLAAVGRGGEEASRRAVDWLLARQEPDGSWIGRWGANHVYGVGAVVPALVAAGIPVDHPAIRAAVAWLVRNQSADGGWGEDPRSYLDPAWVGRGEPTPSQTAWALLALLAADPESRSVSRGVRWLVDRQRPDGTWDEPQFTGTGFPRDLVMIRYGMYRHVFPLAALGRAVAAFSRAELPQQTA